MVYFMNIQFILSVMCQINSVYRLTEIKFQMYTFQSVYMNNINLTSLNIQFVYTFISKCN